MLFVTVAWFCVCDVSSVTFPKCWFKLLEKTCPSKPRHVDQSFKHKLTWPSSLFRNRRTQTTCYNIVCFGRMRLQYTFAEEISKLFSTFSIDIWRISINILLGGGYTCSLKYCNVTSENRNSILLDNDSVRNQNMFPRQQIDA
jgi:hypothetical protein